MYRLKIILCLLLVLLFTSASRAQLRKIRVAIPAHGISNMALYVAKDRGYFREEGLEAQLILMRPTIGNNALIGGNVEISMVPTAGLASALRGARLRILSATFYKPLFWLYAKGEIKSVKELKGKTVAISSIGSAVYYLALDLLAKHGLVGGRDVAIIGTGHGPVKWAAFTKGAADAAILNNPWNLRAEDAGYRELVNYLQEDTILFLGSIVVHENLLRSNRELVRKFTRAALKGFFDARDDRAGVIPSLARGMRAKKRLAERSYDAARPVMTKNFALTKELARKHLKFVLKVQGLKQSPPVEKFYDFSMVQELLAELKGRK